MKKEIFTRSFILEAVAVIAIVLIFSWLRLAHIQTSLLFFGDLGRDYFVLQQWQMTGKPPLLGPQTSALPFNQSAIYFYLLYPFYLLLNHSLFATVIANWTYHLLVFGAGLYLLRRHTHLRLVWLISWFLIAVQPQYVAQHRYIWNPSFVGMSLLTAYISFELLLKKFKPTTLAIFSLSLAAATAFSYSAIPVLLAFGALALIYLRQKIWQVGLALTASLALVNLPTIAFEIRHKFVLTQLMLHGEKLEQSGKALSIKLDSLERFVLAGPGQVWNLLWLTGFVVLIGLALYQKRQTLKTWSQFWQDRLVRASLLLTITFLLLLVLPISLHAHYVFGLVITGMIVLALLPRPLMLISVISLMLLWLPPALNGSYFKPAFRTTQQSLACAQQVCDVLTEPTFVSVQAGYHPYHNGFEFKYLLKEKGCTVYDIETEPERAEYMAVFADKSEYQHGKTAYNELTQFGESEEIDQIACEGEMRVHILQRLDP